MRDEKELPFSLDWLLGAAELPEPTLSVCEQGHLVVKGRTHYLPVRLSPDMKSMWFRWVEHEEAR